MQVAQQIYRCGECVNCGDCCILWVDGRYQRCMWYDMTKEKHCMIYKSRPQACRDFPRGPADQLDKPLCGYYFLDEKGRRVDAFQDRRVTLKLLKKLEEP
jgi:Fe-S-cluster containining protein